MIRFLLMGCLIWLGTVSITVAQTAQNESRIGVLAYRGSDEVHLQWTGLGDYLNAAIPDWSFQIVPMTLSSAHEQIETGQLDFIVTNPGHFVTLNRIHRMSVLASRMQQKSDGTFSGEFGSGIVVLPGSNIENLRDVAGKSVVAVAAEAFGGFQLAWYEFDRIGVDLFDDKIELRFVGFPMDQIVMQVLSGEADVGIVRSGLIESLVGEGRIDPDALVFLNANRTYTHTDVVSTGLFPEWPFVALASTPQPLKDQVAVALLTAGQTTIARDVGMIDRWSSPVPYHGVVALTDAFRARITRLTAKQPAPWISIFAMLSGLVTAGAVFFWWRGSFSNANTSENSALASKTDAAGLTNREKQILDFVVLGRSTKEIAIALDISPKTVEFHRSNILKKYGAQTSIQLVMMAT